MINFYNGFEKRAGKEMAQKFLKSMWGNLKKPFSEVNTSRRDNFAILSGKDVKKIVNESADTISKRFKEDIVPQMNAVIDRAHQKGVGVDLSNLKTFKKGILPTMAAGAGFEAGRQALNAASKFPDYAQKRRQEYQQKHR